MVTTIQSRSERTSGSSMGEVFLKWDPAQVASFVESILPEDEKYISHSFLDQNIEGGLLPFITTQHLSELGIRKLSSRLIIKKNITELISKHYQSNPPKSFSDPEYNLNNINVNNNYISHESLLVSTILIKDMLKKIATMKNSPLIASIVSNINSDTLPLSPETQGDFKRLQESFVKLKTDLIPVVRLIKESKPLPTPTLDPGPISDSPTFSFRSDTSDEKTVDMEIPSPTSTFSNRFSSGSLLSMGTGKIIQQSIPKLTETRTDFKLQNLDKKEKAISGLNRSLSERPKILETKSQPKLINPSKSLTNLEEKKPVLKQAISTNSIKTNSHNLYNQQPPSNEPLKQLRASTDDSCLKILQQAMKRYHIPRNDWSKYVLVVCYGNKERILKLAEKPVSIVKELHELGRHPTIMLRQLAEVTEEVTRYEDSRIVDDIPGGSL